MLHQQFTAVVYHNISILYYFMTSFRTADVGLKGDQNSLDRGIQCKINEMSRNWHERRKKFVSGITP